MTRGTSTYAQQDENILAIQKGDGNLPDLLFELLRHASPHGLEKHIINLLPFKKEGKVDEFGNFIIKVGDAKTMFSCHMDTVHHADKQFIESGQKGLIHLLTLGPEAKESDIGFVWGGITNKDKALPHKYNPIQLGADDKAGCWIMSEMIDHDIPGLYIFHAGEEAGGLGSSWILKNTPALVKGIDRAIAFDRAGTADVIGWQRGGTCASMKFMTALCEQLNKFMPASNLYKPDIHGTFTDTANYITLIKECTNISVGYYNQHGFNEKLDFFYLTKMLMPAILQVKWDELPAERALTKEYSNGRVLDNDYTYNARCYTYNGEDYGYWEHGKFVVTRKADTSKYLEWKFITRHTQDNLIPAWKPVVGVPNGITWAGLAAVIQKYMKLPPNGQIAEDFATVIIGAETYKLKNQLLERKLEILDHFLAMDEQSGKRLLDKIIEDHKDFDKNANVTDVEYSDVSADEQGFPLYEKEMTTRSSDKMMIMGVYVSNRTATKMNTQQQGNFGQLVGRYNKLKGHINQSKNGISKPLYKSINSVFYRMTEIMKECDTCALADNAIQVAQEYIKENRNEPGFPEVQAG